MIIWKKIRFANTIVEATNDPEESDNGMTVLAFDQINAFKLLSAHFKFTMCVVLGSSPYFSLCEIEKNSVNNCTSFFLVDR